MKTRSIAPPFYRHVSVVLKEIDAVTPAQRKREARKAKSQKMLRAAEFELRARNMGFTDKPLITQKVAIWEGMLAAEQSGDSVGVGIPYPAPFPVLLWKCG